MKSKTPTDEQQLIIDCETSRVVAANPGSGKTFTLSQIIRKLLLDLPSYKGIIAISYTNKASEELKERCIGDGLDKKKSFFKTIDSFFISEIVMPFLPFLWGRIEDVKIQKIGTLELEIEGDRTAEVEVFKKDLAQKLDIDVVKHQNLLRYLYKNRIILLESVGALANYVFDNSLACRKYIIARYTHVFVDEYQDSGNDQHQFFLKLMELGLCAVAVGDVNQSIYGFSGKKSMFLESLMTDDRFKVFGLTANMRCHKSISNYSLKMISSHAHLQPVNELRIFHKQLIGDETKISVWLDDKLEIIKEKFNIANNNQICVLVRSDRTGSLIEKNLKTKHKYLKNTSLDSGTSHWGMIFKALLNFIFISEETKTKIIESYGREFKRKDLKALSEKLDQLRQLSGQPHLLALNLDVFIEIAKLLQPTESDQNAILDLQRILKDLDELLSYVPAQTDEIQIMTLHKSKGLEFKVVIHADLYNWVMPSYKAMKGDREEYLQDLNLHYVGVTRAIEACFLVTTSIRTKSDMTTTGADSSNLLDINGLLGLRVNIK